MRERKGGEGGGGAEMKEGGGGAEVRGEEVRERKGRGKGRRCEVAYPHL